MCRRWGAQRVDDALRVAPGKGRHMGVYFYVDCRGMRTNRTSPLPSRSYKSPAHFTNTLARTGRGALTQ